MPLEAEAISRSSTWFSIARRRRSRAGSRYSCARVTSSRSTHRASSRSCSSTRRRPKASARSRDSNRELASADIARDGSAPSWFPRDGRDPTTLAARARDRAQGSVPDEAEPDVIVADARMSALHELVGRVAATDITVLLLGETGVGKEVLAEMIHRRSARARQAVPAAQLRGVDRDLARERAVRARARRVHGRDADASPDCFEAADGGTVFLDEVGELPPSTQVKLLRVLEERKVLARRRAQAAADRRAVRRGDEPRSRGRGRSAATSARISTFASTRCRSSIPPLRERVDEIEPLARAFLRRDRGEARRARRLDCREDALDAARGATAGRATCASCAT